MPLENTFSSLLELALMISLVRLLPSAGIPGEVQVADVGGLQGAGLRGLRPCRASRAELPAGICRQGRALIRACSSGWFFFTAALLVGFLPACLRRR
jgi:hypothetical protein